MLAVALGNFDGVHLAHQAVLKQAAAYEDSVCLLFRRHPLEVLCGSAPEKLLSAEQTREKILACGIRRCDYLEFEQVMDESPVQFFENVIVGTYGADVICCGYNYTFGKNKAGTVQTLKKLCKQYAIGLHVAEEIDYLGQSISSTRIRRCIQNGEIESANQMLGYRYFYEGEVMEGKQLGGRLGFPTINLHFDADRLKPHPGVYASEVSIGGETYQGITNIGNNPTIGSDPFRSETFLFDFHRQVYGQTARVTLKTFLREEKKFESLQALEAQVLADIERAKHV